MKREAGFTLIELLVALVAGSFLIVSLSWTLSTLTQQVVRGSEQRSGQAFAALAPRLSAMLDGVQPPSEPTQFVADEKRLLALVPPPRSLGSTGLLRLQLEVRRTGNGEALFAQFEPTHMTAGLAPAAREERLLLDGFRSISFHYTPAAAAQPPRTLPALITIEATDQEGIPHRVSAAPKIDSDGACRFDPISMSCRY